MVKRRVYDNDGVAVDRWLWETGSLEQDMVSHLPTGMEAQPSGGK